jgi:hypothetical protein
VSQHAIYITGIDFERDAWQGHAVRGLRALWDVIDPDHGLGYRVARDVIGQFAEDPYTASLAGTHTDLEVVGGAIAKALELSENVLTFGVDLEDTALGERPEEAAEEASDDFFSPAAYRTALVHLAYANGNPTLAYHRTFSMAKATDDPTLWEEVRAVLESAFTHDGEEPGDGGPPIVLVQ